MIEISIRYLGNGGENIVYLGQPNNLSLELLNLSDEAIEIVPGAPADPPVDGGPFSLMLNLGALFTDPAQAGDISIAATGWTAQFFRDPYASWVLTRQSGTSWLPNTKFIFAISNLVPTATTNASVATTIYNADIIPIVQSQVMTIADPNAGPRDLRTTMAIDVHPGTVYGTKSEEQTIRNSIELTFFNTNANEPLVPNDVPWDGTPEFIVSFTYGNPPGAFALTTTADAAAFGTSISAGTGWNVPSPADGPSWRLTPLASNHAILGTGLNGAVTFKFDNIVTRFMPGVTQGYVQYANIPGFADGNLSFLLRKEYQPVAIRNFAINEQVVSGGIHGNEPAQTFLSWNVDHAMLVLLSTAGAVAPIVARHNVEINQGESFVLSAIDPITGGYVTAKQSATVTPSMLSRSMPPGTIFLWSGRMNDLPPGLAICDGTNGTPDLRQRFVLAAGPENAGDSGVTTHTHDYPQRFNQYVPTSQTGAHGHTPSPANSGWNWRGLDEESFFSRHPGVDTGGTNYWNSPLQSNGNHSHQALLTVPADTTSVNSPNLRPRWYALMYVMKRYAA